MKSINELFDLSGRVALVTGGAGHLGGVIGEALAECGASVGLLDLKPLDSILSGLPSVERGAHVAFQTNLLNEEDVLEVPSRVVKEMGRLDILVNCAALVGSDDLKGWVEPLENQSLRTWRDALEINLTAPFALIKASIPKIRESGNGSIVNIGSIYGLLGPDWSIYNESDVRGTPAAYGVSKGGLLQLTRWLATSLAPDIRVNSIVPGGIERKTSTRFRKEYEKRTPMGRMGKEEDFKGAISYLASDASSYVTGQSIVVDGGWSSW